MNVDGALFTNLQEVGVSIVLRENKGEVMLAASMRVQSNFDPMIVESLAILWGLQLCMYMGIPRLVIGCLRTIIS